MIGGNIDLELQTKTTEYDEIGARVATWKTVQTLRGWLDYSSGEKGRTNYKAEIEETTHIFICEYVELLPVVKSENCRAVANGKVYDILLPDNPMEMNIQLEIYLKYTGGQNG